MSGGHTPGPWAVFHDHPDPETALSLGYIRPADGSSGAMFWGFREIADCYGCENPEQAANARLIAAAPELLEALRAVRLEAQCMVRQMSRAGWHVPHNGAVMRAIRAADAAIEKATGGAS